MIVFPRQLVPLLTAAIFVIGGVTSVSAATFSGTVISVSGDVAKVAMNGDVMPPNGARAEFFFKIAGGDDEISVATGSVLKIDQGDLVIKIENATGKVEKGHLVRITSEKPGERAATTPAPATSPVAALPTAASAGDDPSFAFVDLSKIFNDHPKAKERERQINATKDAAKQEYDKRLAAKDPGLNEWRAEQEKQLQAQALKFRDEIVAEMREKIRELSAPNVNLVFDTSGNTLNAIPFILHFPSGADMSARVTAALQGSQARPFESTRGLRLGVVDLNDVFHRARKTKEAEAKINADKNTSKKEYDRRAALYRKDSDRIASLSGAARAKAVAKLRTAEQEIKAFLAAKEKELRDQAEVLRREITDEIVTALRAAVKGESSALIFDVSGESVKGVPLLVVTGQLPDLSNNIVATVNSGSSVPTSTSPLVSSSTLRVACADLRRAAAALPANDSLAASQFVERVRRIAATEKFDLVLDSGGLSANGVPLLLSVHEIPDLTDKVIAEKK